jgi:hypothetical protein
MRLPTIFRLPGYQVFSYKPRFYDKQKEDLKSRVKQAIHEIDGNAPGKYPEGYIPDIKGRLRNRPVNSFDRIRRRAGRQSNLRLLIILLFLCLLAYFLFFK